LVWYLTIHETTASGPHLKQDQSAAHSIEQRYSPKATMDENPEQIADHTGQRLSRSVCDTRDRELLHLYSLVLSAADIPHVIRAGSLSGWAIDVSIDDFPRADEELRRYEAENSNWPERPPPQDDYSPFFRAQAILISCSLMLLYAVTGPWTANTLWFERGAVAGARIIEHGEYYRLLTGLTLHADLVHLLGNCLLGGFLIHFFFLLLGNGIGLAALLLSSCLANYLNVIGHGQHHHSVGFSTAVFAVIGMLSALNYRHHRFTRPARLLLPIMAGTAMLAMLGSGSEDGRTDLGAHFYGLLCGLALGTVLGIEPVFLLRRSIGLQSLLTLTSLSLPLIAWYLALR
jgi:rhomboid protease GluP